MLNPKISIVIPFHWMKNWPFFMQRCLESIEQQTFTDYEIILTKHGKMAENSNKAIMSASGELIKILYMDDYFAHPMALQLIVEDMGDSVWGATACLHAQIGETPHSLHSPKYTQDIHTGNNKIGSPSVIIMRKDSLKLFDENLSWLLDCDLYRRLYDAYGPPKIIDDMSVVIGIGDHQTSNLMSQEEKLKEFEYLQKKYV